jgi:8-oxo-dGTP pyrophosphatase MutT (NUDIX family)
MLTLATRLQGRLRREEDDAAGLTWAAVALVLRGRVPNDAELLFIQRAVRAGDPWSGHIAFPGGRRDLEDASLEVTARRETSEELSLDLAQHAVLLGALDDLRPRSAALPSIAVRPFVFSLSSDVPLRPNAEVQSTFWMPIRALRDPATATEYVVERAGTRLRFPAYRWNDHVVWGMTERFVAQLLEISAAL